MTRDEPPFVTLVDPCDFTWPLLDPNPEDAEAGRTHECMLPTAHHEAHRCGCGDEHVEGDPGRLYTRCTDPNCPVDYAYRFDGSKAPHFHYVGGPDAIHPPTPPTREEHHATAPLPQPDPGTT